MNAAQRLAAAGAGIVFALGGAVGACSSSSSSPGTTQPDSGGGDDSGGLNIPDPSKSTCGHAGDKGNALGVGKFCTSSADCSDNTRATLCAIIGDDTSFFCTFPCHEDGGPDQCGEGAECACQGACGCFPNVCDDRPDATTDAGSDADASDATTD